MALPKPTRGIPALGVTTRSRSKRKADGSPHKENAAKRAAFEDISNATKKKKAATDAKAEAAEAKNGTVRAKATVDAKTKAAEAKNVLLEAKALPTGKTVSKSVQKENLPPPPAPAIASSRNVLRSSAGYDQPAQKSKEVKVKEIDEVSVTKVKTRLSNEFEKSNESLYTTALEEINASIPSTNSGNATAVSKVEANSTSTMSNISAVAARLEKQLKLVSSSVPEGIDDFDKINLDDIFQVSNYAMDIFQYLKSRESEFVIDDYMAGREDVVTRSLRAVLVDWMVEIQENFELNHETLYLGVKLVDRYLSRATVDRRAVELVGLAAMFVASKYDERVPPSVDDFLHVCGNGFRRREFFAMEMSVLRACDFNLGVPLSYRFLRRYARCAQVRMPVLTLARFILEYSLLDYDTIRVLDSKLAAAALYLALQMKKISGWTPTLVFYTGYSFSDIHEVVYLLNENMHGKRIKQPTYVRTKYSHTIYFEVAKTPLIKNEDLCPL